MTSALRAIDDGAGGAMTGSFVMRARRAVIEAHGAEVIKS